MLKAGPGLPYPGTSQITEGPGTQPPHPAVQDGTGEAVWFPGFAFLLLGALWPFSAWMPESAFSRAQLSTFSSFSVSSPVVVPSVVLRGIVDILGLSPRVSFSFLFFFFCP